eukprot:Gb_26546 [translate_table: standard]
MQHRRTEYISLGQSAGLPSYPTENSPHDKIRLTRGQQPQHHYSDDHRNRAVYSRPSSLENGINYTSFERVSCLFTEERMQDDTISKGCKQVTADNVSCFSSRSRPHFPSRHEPRLHEFSGESHVLSHNIAPANFATVERQHPYPDWTPFQRAHTNFGSNGLVTVAVTTPRERKPASSSIDHVFLPDHNYTRAGVWTGDRSSIGSSSYGGRGLYLSGGLQRQSSGSSFADSLPSSEFPLPTFSPSVSLNASDSAFFNALYDEGWRHDERRLSNSDDSSKNWAQQTEESYNLQLALALRLTAEASTTEELHLLDSHFKETNVGSGSSTWKSVEGVAHRFWVNGSLSYHDKVQDGFYYIWGMNPYVWAMCNDFDESGRMPSLESLRFVDARDSSMEVVLIDKRGDSHLRELENKALGLSYGCTNTKEVAEQLGKLVCMLMGGAASTEHGDLMMRWKVSSKMLRDCLNCIVLPIGSLSVGLCRHRSLLFKVLADTVDLPCRIARGCKYCGLDDGSSCLVQCGDDREYFVDLIGKPGSLCEPDSFVNGQFSLMIASPLRLPDFKSSQLTDEVRSLARQYASESGSLEMMFDKKDSKLQVAGHTGDSSRDSVIPHSEEAIVPFAVASAVTCITTESSLQTPVASPPVYDAAMRHPVGKQVEILNEAEVTSGCGIVSDIVMTKDQMLPDLISGTLGGECAKFQAEHLSTKASKDDASELMSGSIKANSNDEECLQQRPLQVRKQKDVLVKPNDEVSPQQRHLQIHKQRDAQTKASDEDSLGQRHMQNQKHKDTQAKLEISRQGTGRSKDGRVEENGGALKSKANLEISLAVDGLEIPWEDLILKERIGAGSFGTVHRADWHGSDVAVKILIEQDFHEERLKEFLREVAIMKRLRHPNVVLFMGAVTMRPNLSIVTEYLPRGSLYRLIHRAGAREILDERRRLRMALDVAKGMNYLHWLSPPIVHRDLKSPNLLVDKTWTVKVCDFGLSRFKANTFLSSKSAAGTPEWMAPEVLRDEPSNEKSDIYSFGVILWELVTMQQPWSGLSPAQVVGAVGFQNRRLQIPKDMNPEIATIIESCWATDSRQRPSFASIMESLKPLVKPPVTSSIHSGMTPLK